MGRTTHQLSHTRAYVIWKMMLARCNDARQPNYKDYGGRGIKVRVRWLTFENFLYDMGQPPELHQLDRIDTNDDYYPLNCRWSTKKENMRNRRNTVFIEFEGQKKSLSEWAEIVGIPWPTIKARIRRGWSVSEALSK